MSVAFSGRSKATETAFSTVEIESLLKVIRIEFDASSHSSVHSIEIIGSSSLSGCIFTFAIDLKAHAHDERWPPARGCSGRTVRDGSLKLN
jgi:hypothetical protein